LIVRPDGSLNLLLIFPPTRLRDILATIKVFFEGALFAGDCFVEAPVMLFADEEILGPLITAIGINDAAIVKIISKKPVFRYIVLNISQPRK
jgi:hypothetical protein